MNTNTIVPTTQVDHQHDAIEEMRLDALDGMADKDNGKVQPNPEDETFLDQRTQKEWDARAVKFREQLAGEYAVAVYRQIAGRDRDLTHAQFRVLDAQMSFSTKLTNVFPSRKQLLTRTGPIKTLAALDKILGRLERKGWEHRVLLKEGDRVLPATSMDDGLLGRSSSTGRFTSAVGVVFCIPPNVLAPGDEGWTGPRKFDHREWGQRRSSVRKSRRPPLPGVVSGVTT